MLRLSQIAARWFSAPSSDAWKACALLLSVIVITDETGQAREQRSGYHAVNLAKVYVGGIHGAETLASAADMAHLTQAKNVSFYLTSFTLTQVEGLNLGAILRNWHGHKPGIIEVGTDPINMPEIATRYGRCITRHDNWTWGTKGSAWPGIIRAAGWRPEIAMLNVFPMRTAGGRPEDDPYFQMNLRAMAYVQALAPSVHMILPYLTPNQETVSADKGDLNWTDPYWNASRALARKAGGFGLDTPANYFMHAREPAYRNLVVQQIRWAKENGLKTNLLLSIFDIDNQAPGIRQFRYDAHFVEAVQEEIRFLHEHGADPSFYSIVNYSEGPHSNSPGPDTEHETLGAAALWTAEHSRVSG